MQFITNKRILAVLALFAIAAVLAAVRGIHFGLEFTGGIRIPATLAEPATADIMEKELSIIKTKLNAFGLTQVIVRGVGDRQIYIEVPESDPKFIEKIEKILTAEGKFEAIIDKKVALSGAHLLPGSITSYVQHTPAGVEWVVTFYVSREGGEQFADVAYGKAHYPVYLYLDRAQNSILLLDRKELEPPEFAKDEVEAALEEHLQFNNISILYLDEAWKDRIGALEANETNKTTSKTNKTNETYKTNKTQQITVITANREAERWLAQQNVSTKFVDTTTPTFARSRLGVLIVERWPAIGLLSAPFLSEGLATGQISQQFQITGPAIGRTEDERMENARLQSNEIKSILTGGALPISISLGSRILIPPILGEVFLFYSFVGLAVGYLVVMAIVWLRYRNLSALGQIGFVSIMQMSTLILILGSLGTIDLSAVAGLFAAMGTSVDSQIVVIDSLARREDVRRALKDAFYIITRDAAVVSVALIPLILSNIVEIIGFATVFMLGLILNIFITTQTATAIIEAKETKNK